MTVQNRQVILYSQDARGQELVIRNAHLTIIAVSNLAT